MNALVTGVTGFIGGALASALADAGWQVRTLVRPASQGRLANAGRYQVITADLSDEPALRAAVCDCDVIFHAAAIRNRWGTSPDDYRQVNVEGTRRLLAASIGRARRFVYVSSVGVMGHPGVAGIDESFPIIKSVDKADYHSTKAEAERIVRACQAELETVITRPTITYGPGDADGMLTRMIDMIARGRFVCVGSGRNHVHLTFIDDLVHGLKLAGTHPAAAGQIFILSGPASIAVRDLVKLITSLLKLPYPRSFVPEAIARIIGLSVEQAYRIGWRAKLLPPGAAPPITPDKIDTLCIHRGFSSARASRLLGYTPLVEYAEGVARTFEWMTATHRLPLSDAMAKTR